MMSKNIIRYLFLPCLILLTSLNLFASNLYKTNADLKVRSGPGSKYKAIGVIHLGDTIAVNDSVNKKWFRIEFKNRSGYLSSKFLEPVQQKFPKTVEVAKIENENSNPNTLKYGIIGTVVVLILLIISLVKKSSKEVEIRKSIDESQKQILNNEPNISGKNNIYLTNSRTTSINSTINDSYNSSKMTDNKSVVSKGANLEIKSPANDSTIIDVVNENYDLNITTENSSRPIASRVPYWTHHYVYSFSELESATNEQKAFYAVFKQNFLNGNYIDLEGNNNYAFILLFDLLNEYDVNKNFDKTLTYLKALGTNYPKTSAYTLSQFDKKLKQNISNLKEQQKIEENKSVLNNYDFNDNYWQLGTKYKSVLNLSIEDAQLLNSIWTYSNNFTNIEYCNLEVIRFFLLTIKTLKNSNNVDEIPFDDAIIEVAHLIATKQFRFKKGNNNYKLQIEQTTKEIYSNIFKYCENFIREKYGHKRKINTDTFFTEPTSKLQYETKILSKLPLVFKELDSKISPPDESTEIELNLQNTSRWKIQFERLIENYTNPMEFADSIIALGRYNKKNPSIENIFFEASKFISKYDKETALKFYVYYLYYDLQSTTFDYKQLTKTIQKSLFKTAEQLQEFEAILNQLIQDKNLDAALNAASKIYELKRKKIQLDTNAIKEVQQQHSGTVELLNEYLKDDNEEEKSKIEFKESNKEEVTININHNVNLETPSIYSKEIPLTSIHTATLELFVKSNFAVLQSDLELFAKSKGVFKNQLVESINETCYEILDDVLIEEEDEYYTINENYYKKILVQ